MLEVHDSPRGACPASTDSYLPVVLNSTEDRAESPYWVESTIFLPSEFDGANRPKAGIDVADMTAQKRPITT
jgi:hypothetical protein